VDLGPLSVIAGIAKGSLAKASTDVWFTRIATRLVQTAAHRANHAPAQVVDVEGV
jgi:hypothetical protein